MLNLMATFICPALDIKCLFWANLFQKNHNCLFKMKFDTYSNSNMLNSLVILNFLFWAENTFSGQSNFKISRLSVKMKFGTWSNWISWIQSWWHIYFRPDIGYLGRFGLKLENYSLKVKLGTTLTHICKIWWWWCLFMFWT